MSVEAVSPSHLKDKTPKRRPPFGRIVVAAVILWLGIAWYREELGERLIDAAWKNDVRAGTSLLARGADTNAYRDRKDRFRGIVKVLLDLISPTDQKRGYTPLLIAAMNEHDDTKFVSVLLDHGAPVNASGWMNQTALGNAAGARNRRVCELLLDRGAQVNQLGLLWEPPMTAACWEVRSSRVPKRPLLPVVRLLCEAGGAVDAPDHRGRTPLMGAAANGEPDAIQYLLRSGADPSLSDADKQTALDYAIGTGNEDAVRLLRDAKRRPEAANASVR